MVSHHCREWGNSRVLLKASVICICLLETELDEVSVGFSGAVTVESVELSEYSPGNFAL